MPNQTPANLQFGIVEPRDAIAAFERRKLLQPSFRWQDVWQEEHTRALAVAGVQRLDVLQVFQDGLAAKFKAGTSLADFAKDVRPQLQAKGWWGDVEITDPQTGETRITRFDDRRLKLIYDVNVRQSYAAGQWARIERNKARMPFIIYRTMDDAQVRAAHAAWNNLVLPVDHPFWKTHFPPCGWRCRCKAFAIDQAGIDRLKSTGRNLQFEDSAVRSGAVAQPVGTGRELKFEAPPEQLVNYVNPRTGEVAAVPRGIDPGFGYNPGIQERDEALHEQTLRKAWAAQPLAGAVAVAQATFARQEMVAATTARFGAWVDEIDQQMKAEQFLRQGAFQYIGTLKPTVVRALDARGMSPATAAIAVRDEDIVHALREDKAEAGVALSASVYRRMPELLERATAVLLDLSKPQPALLYVIDLIQPNGEVGKLVVNIDQPLPIKIDGKRTKVLMNVVRTATVMNPSALQDRKKYRLLWGHM